MGRLPYLARLRLVPAAPQTRTPGLTPSPVPSHPRPCHGGCSFIFWAYPVVFENAFEEYYDLVSQPQGARWSRRHIAAISATLLCAPSLCALARLVVP